MFYLLIYKYLYIYSDILFNYSYIAHGINYGRRPQKYLERNGLPQVMVLTHWFYKKPESTFFLQKCRAFLQMHVI